MAKQEIPNRRAKIKCMEIKDIVNNLKNQEVQQYLENLNPAKVTDYSFWKATKELNQPQ